MPLTSGLVPSYRDCAKRGLLVKTRESGSADWQGPARQPASVGRPGSGWAGANARALVSPGRVPRDLFFLGRCCCYCTRLPCSADQDSTSTFAFSGCGGCAVDISHLIAHHECITTRDSKRRPESGINVWNPPPSLISSFLISFSHFVLIFLYSPALLDPHHIHALPCRVLTEKQ